MKLDFQKTACRFLASAAREVQNTELTQELRLSDGMPDIGRTLASWGQVIIRSKEWRGNTVTVSGGVMIWLLYAPEDGTEPRCIDGWIPFQLRWELPETDREGPVRISPLLRFVDSRTVSARKFMVRVGLAAMGEALYPKEEEIYTPGELPEDVEVLRRLYPVRLPKEAGEKTFLIDEELTFPAGTDVPEKVIAYTLRPEVSDQKVMGNKVVFRGAGKLHLIFRCARGILHTRDFEVPFSQFSELEGTYGPDAQTDIQMGTTSLELDSAEGGKLRLKCGLVAQYLVDDRELLELTEDAYSPFRDVQTQREELKLPSILENRKQTVTAEQMLSGKRGNAVDVNFLPDYPRQRRIGDEVTLEGNGLFQVLYNEDDGTPQSASLRWEESQTLPVGEDGRLTAMVQPIGEPRWMDRGDDMAVSADFQMHLQTTSDHGLPMVTGLELGELEEPDPGRPSLILSRPGTESLWELAKRCGSTTSAIQKANGIQEEAPRDRMLLIPVS